MDEKKYVVVSTVWQTKPRGWGFFNRVAFFKTRGKTYEGLLFSLSVSRRSIFLALGDKGFAVGVTW